MKKHTTHSPRVVSPKLVYFCFVFYFIFPRRGGAFENHFRYPALPIPILIWHKVGRARGVVCVGGESKKAARPDDGFSETETKKRANKHARRMGPWESRVTDSGATYTILLSLGINIVSLIGVSLFRIPITICPPVGYSVRWPLTHVF